MADETKDNSGYKKSVNSWVLYHFAENGFATTVVSAVLPVYYSKVAASNLGANTATVYWGYTTTITVLLAALLAPVLGTLANLFGIRKRLLLSCAAVGIFASVFLYFVTTGDWLLASIIFIVSNTGYSLGDVMHDSLLPHVAKPDDIDKVSTKGFGFGYAGGSILLAINIAMLQLIHDKELAARLCFLSVSVWWTVFTIPLILNVREPRVHGKLSLGKSALLAGYDLLSDTFHNIKKYRQLLFFLIAFLVYNDGVGTIARMALIYGSELGLSSTTLIGALLMTLIVGVPFAFIFGWLAKYTGAKNCIYIGLFIYTLISIGGFFITKPIHFWILAFMVGTVQGGTQALSRSLFGSMTPKAKTAEFFGFYGMSSRLGGFLGPFVFALVAQLTGSSRYSITAIFIFFLAGAILLTRVNVKEGVRTATEEDKLM